MQSTANSLRKPKKNKKTKGPGLIQGQILRENKKTKKTKGPGLIQGQNLRENQKKQKKQRFFRDQGLRRAGWPATCLSDLWFFCFFLVFSMVLPLD